MTSRPGERGPTSIVLCTAPSSEAETLADRIVEARLAACVNLIGTVRSKYRWEGAIETAEETLLVIKTTRARVAELQARIVEWHSYDVPEVLEVGVESGFVDYLAWVHASCAEQ